MRYLHTMLRVRNLDAALDFYCNKLGLKEVRRRVDEKGRFTLVFLAAPRGRRRWSRRASAAGRDAPLVELTYNWDTEDYGEARYFGHLAYEVDDIYATLREADEGRRHHQPAAARRRDGVRALARQAFDRAPAEGRRAAAEGAVEVDAEYRQMVSRLPPLPRGIGAGAFLPRPANASICRRASRALRLAVQDAALSRRKHGFDSRRARHSAISHDTMRFGRPGPPKHRRILAAPWMADVASTRSQARERRPRVAL